MRIHRPLGDVPGKFTCPKWLISPRCSTWGYQPLGDSNHLEYLGDMNSGFFFQYLQAVPPSPGPQTKYTSKEQSLQTEFEETDPHRSRKIMAVEGGTFYIGLLAQ
jgi:hypothetical protein